MQTLDSKSLSVQLVISLVGLALLTALMVGLPAIWLIRNQLESRAWAQVHQGVQATRALYSAREQDLDNLATLTAQRPSLRLLLQPVDREDLTAYLQTLRQGAGLDWIAVCDTDGNPIAQVVDGTTGALPSRPCSLHPAQIVPAIASTGEVSGVWLMSGESIKAENEETIGTVTVGRQLNAAFAAQMRSQTGLDHTLWFDDISVVTSLNGDGALTRKASPAQDRDDAKSTFAWAGKPYYADRLMLQAPDGSSTSSIQAEVALAVADVIAAEQRLVRGLLGSIVLASAVAFVLALFLARRISRPLGELADAAAAMSRGDLSKPFTSDTNIREVALVGKALNGARADLQQTLDELRREKAWTDHLLANVSHEFRTPLSAVAAAVELLMDQAPDLSPDEIQELLTSLHLGVLNLQKLVDNLLESASIEAGRFQVHPRPYNLDSIIVEAVRTMQPLLNKYGQRLTVELPASIPIVQADPRRTVQVLVNLISNASKYGPTDTEITVGVVAVHDWVRVTIGDHGPGIPAEQRVDLFQRFATSEAAGSDRQAGFGLGLSVVKAIVEGHNGQVGVDDRPGGGSVFWFTLPVVNS